MDAWQVEERYFLSALHREDGHVVLAEALDAATFASVSEEDASAMRDQRNTAWRWLCDIAKARGERVPRGVY